MRRGVLIAVLAVAFWGGAFRMAQAQTDTGTIDGRVLDEQKAAVLGATVTAKNNATGLARSTVSASTGTFRIESVPAGVYDVTAELQGFALQLHKDVVVQVAQ